MTETQKSNSLARLARWLLFCLGFAMLPLYLFNLGMEDSQTRQQEKQSQQEADRLMRILEKIRGLGSDEHFYFLALSRVTDKIAGSLKDPRRGMEKIQGLLKTIHRKNPGLFEFYITNAEGDLVDTLSSPVLSKVVVKKLHFEFIKGLNIGNYDYLQGMRKTFELFLGETGKMEDLLRMSPFKKVMTTSITRKHTYFFARSMAGQGCVMAHINAGAVSPFFPMRQLLGKAQRVLPNVVFGFHSVGKSFDHPNLLPEEVSLVNNALTRFESSSQEIFFQNGYSIAILKGDANSRLWALSRPEERGKSLSRGLIPILCLAAFFLLAGLSFGYLVPEPARWLSIHTKLVGLLGFATGLPLVILLVSGQDYLREKEQSLINQSYQDMALVLRGFDTKFLLMHQRHAATVKTLIRKSTDAGGNFSLSKYEKASGRTKDTSQYITPMVIAKDGSVIVSREKDQMLYQLALRMLMRYNQSLGFPEDEKAKKQLKLDALFSTDKQLTDLTRDLLRRIGEICRITFGKLDKFLYMNIIPGPNGIANNMLFFFWKPKELSFQYIKGSLLTYQRDLPDSRLFAVYPTDGEKTLPPDCRKNPWLNAFLDRLQARAGLTFDRATWRGRPYLVAGIPGRELQGFYIIQISPLSRISKPVAELREKLLFLGGLSLFLALTVGTLLAQQFMLPVGHLDSAVKAIDTGVFDHRIPVLENDELGKLSTTFNGMMEGLEQLSVARAVQSSLFPSQPLHTEEWSVWGCCSPASELGGDYYDYFPLDDGRLVILIGDVSGHGVPAALVMAMAKATVANEIKHNPSPAMVFYRLNELIFATMRRKRFITFFMAVAEKTGGVIQYSNAGHCQPLHCRADGGSAELSGKLSFPLGARKTQEFVEETLTVGPGDKIFLFTDGLVETHDENMNPMGYSAVHDLFSDHRIQPAQDITNLILEKARIWRRNQPPEDDITMIVLERHPRG